MSNHAWMHLVTTARIKRIRTLFGDYIADLILEARARHKIEDIDSERT